MYDQYYDDCLGCGLIMLPDGQLSMSYDSSTFECGPSGLLNTTSLEAATPPLAEPKAACGPYPYPDCETPLRWSCGEDGGLWARPGPCYLGDWQETFFTLLNTGGVASEGIETFTFDPDCDKLCEARPNVRVVICGSIDMRGAFSRRSGPVDNYSMRHAITISDSEGFSYTYASTTRQLFGGARDIRTIDVSEEFPVSVRTFGCSPITITVVSTVRTDFGNSEPVNAVAEGRMNLQLYLIEAC